MKKEDIPTSKENEPEHETATKSAEGETIISSKDIDRTKENLKTKDNVC